MINAMWISAIMIMVSCVMANHLGLVSAIERIISHNIPIVNCSRCFTFWSTLLYCIFACHNIIDSVFVAFCMALLSLWFDVFLGLLDNLYYTAYEYIYKDTEADEHKDGTDAAKNDHNDASKDDTMPEMWWVEDE